MMPVCEVCLFDHVVNFATLGKQLPLGLQQRGKTSRTPISLSIKKITKKTYRYTQSVELLRVSLLQTCSDAARDSLSKMERRERVNVTLIRGLTATKYDILAV
jgi:hypothetical protein